MVDGPRSDVDTPASGETSHAAATGASEETVDPDAYVTDRRTLAARVQVQWVSRVLGSALVLGVFATVLAGRVGVDPRLGVGAGALIALLGVVWVLLRYRVWAYEVRADVLYLQRGVLTHTRTVVPYVRIQHVDTSRGPVERALGLSTLVVYTAGSRGADVSVPGLTPAEADDLQRRVKELAIEAEGGDAV